MRPEDAAPRADQTTRLVDYRAPDWLVEETRLNFDLQPTATRVTATLKVKRNGTGPADFRLDGHSMRLLSAAIDGRPVPAEAMIEGEESLTVSAAALPESARESGFEWTCVTEIDPSANTALEGLYMSSGMYCTQCEAEGFRKITFYPDRPDVMARFEVRIEGDAPVLLSNGNLVASGALRDGRRFAEWRDPWPKPSYLFALVAGDLVSHDDRFTTQSGREVALRIWVRPGDEDRCAYAMDALKRSMKWDEEVYGREYDLDLFQIVAVDDFNMGAMENKGLNIFNSKYVLASPETATDADYARIEAIIAHEYFHNWTGDRITCRDWFQLCLKEGLTVFRDQQFSADQRSAPVCRIADVATLRARQFREDSGPLAHPVRPEAYVEINNFYTATVYEKGAELIRMLRLLVGASSYRAALDLYFDRHDGEACTIEDWLRVFEDATGRDLSHFALWYSQAGTPRVSVKEDYDQGVYTLTLAQETKPTPGQREKRPLVIPCAYGFLDADGRNLGEDGLLVLDKAEQSFRFDLPERPVASLFRNFSAPAIVERRISPADRAILMGHDTDPFNRWEAARAFALSIAGELADGGGRIDPDWIAALRTTVTDESLDPAFRALVLALPGDDEIAGEIAAKGGVVDPDAIHHALDQMAETLAEATAPTLRELRAKMAVTGPYAPDAESAGRRSLANAALALLTHVDGGEAAEAAFSKADNMTDSLAALRALVHRGAPGAERALMDFRDRWRSDLLVMDKWLMVQATSPAPGALDRVKALAETDFNWRNPNRFRSLIAAFAAGNPVGFHAADGAGYRFFADWLIAMDDANPQTAARTAGAFETWRRYGERRQALIRTELERIMAKPGISKDMGEIVGRILET
ncbi:aminopeptidase N [Pikeienuella piscinae]|uniref:Aminopeptidase N n=1 Tax=Pikeienuella piscinae TaxID=2748098 RepID=A0A7L5BTJ2_9RHOB|nr:aminopeptidase N [Pikeienuella piscinae]QIE54915.1 aminopeptidase N [Pikeienuella piscinae]